MHTDLEPEDRLEEAVRGVWNVVVIIESDVKHLAEGQERLESKLDVTAADLKSQITSVESRLDSKIDALDTKLSSQISALDSKVDKLGEQLVGIARAVGVPE